jgi:hypothetical protein
MTDWRIRSYVEPDLEGLVRLWEAVGLVSGEGDTLTLHEAVVLLRSSQSTCFVDVTNRRLVGSVLSFSGGAVLDVQASHQPGLDRPRS